jgi:hypothetical protein
MDVIIKRESQRKGVFLQTPKGGVMIPLHKMGKNQLNEVIDAELEKSGVPKEERGKIIEKTELDHEQRIKTHLVRQEVRRRLEGSTPQMSKKGGKWTFTR